MWNTWVSIAISKVICWVTNSSIKQFWSLENKIMQSKYKRRISCSFYPQRKTGKSLSVCVIFVKELLPFPSNIRFHQMFCYMSHKRCSSGYPLFPFALKQSARVIYLISLNYVLFSGVRVTCQMGWTHLSNCTYIFYLNAV